MSSFGRVGTDEFERLSEAGVGGIELRRTGGASRRRTTSAYCLHGIEMPRAGLSGDAELRIRRDRDGPMEGDRHDPQRGPRRKRAHQAFVRVLRGQPVPQRLRRGESDHGAHRHRPGRSRRICAASSDPAAVRVAGRPELSGVAARRRSPLLQTGGLSDDDDPAEQLGRRSPERALRLRLWVDPLMLRLLFQNLEQTLGPALSHASLFFYFGGLTLLVFVVLVPVWRVWIEGVTAGMGIGRGGGVACPNIRKRKIVAGRRGGGFERGLDISRIVRLWALFSG